MGLGARRKCMIAETIMIGKMNEISQNGDTHTHRKIEREIGREISPLEFLKKCVQGMRLGQQGSCTFNWD